MEKIILLHVLLLSSTLSYTQSPQGNSTKLLGDLTNEDFFTKSDLIFNGAYLGRQAIYETTVDGQIDTVVVIEYKVFEIYKGDPSLKWQTIYVACEKSKFIFGPFLYSDTLVPSAPRPECFQNKAVFPDYPYSMASIYFLSKSDVVGDGFPEKFPADRRYDFLHDDMSRLYIFKDKIVGLNDLFFQDRKEMYDYMEQFEGCKIPEYWPSRKKQPTKEKIPVSKPVEMDSAIRKIFEERLENDKKKP